MTATALQQGYEFVNRQPGLAYQRAERSLRKFLVIWNGQASERRFPTSQDHVAPGLVVRFITDFLKSGSRFTTGHTRQLAHRSTSTNSSVIAGGIGSSCLRKLAR